MYPPVRVSGQGQRDDPNGGRMCTRSSGRYTIGAGRPVFLSPVCSAKLSVQFLGVVWCNQVVCLLYDFDYDCVLRCDGVCFVMVFGELVLKWPSDIAAFNAWLDEWLLWRGEMHYLVDVSCFKFKDICISGMRIKAMNKHTFIIAKTPNLCICLQIFKGSSRVIFRGSFSEFMV